VLARFDLPTPRRGPALAVAAAAVAAAAALTAADARLGESVILHTLVFYVVTAGAYVALPFVRRGDVMMGAIWLVLLAGVAPCAAGREISAPAMFSDMAGVLMAAAPIYIARIRQVAQGDTRTERRRQAERGGGSRLRASGDHAA
jgi:hypothetical protein